MRSGLFACSESWPGRGRPSFEHIDDDVELDPIRDDPAFVELMKTAHLDRSYYLLWTSQTNFESLPVYGFNVTAHVDRCRQLESQGYRPSP